jgi:hypothetical protein
MASKKVWIGLCAFLVVIAALAYLRAANARPVNAIRWMSTAGNGAGPGDTPTRIDAAVQTLLDKEAIREVLVRYCRGVDRADLELLRSVYHPDAIDNHGSFNGNGWEFADRLVKRAQLALHVLGNMSIDVQGDVAHVETYFVSHTPGIQSGKPTHLTFGGRYVDRFERRNKEWKIARRTLVHDFSRFEVEGRLRPWPGASKVTQGVTGRADVSYKR